MIAENGAPLGAGTQAPQSFGQRRLLPLWRPLRGHGQIQGAYLEFGVEVPTDQMYLHPTVALDLRLSPEAIGAMTSGTVVRLAELGLPFA
jgi:hypothetical protein